MIIDTQNSPFARLNPVPISDVTLKDGFWRTKLDQISQVTIDSQFELLSSTGRLDNFRRLAGEVTKPYQGYVFNDSDVYKWLEAASWVMVFRHDEKLSQMVNQVISLIEKAQDNDGYLNTYFSLERAPDRWSNLQEKHELYCAGHLIQAAIAHYRVTGNDSLLTIAIRFADHIYSTFGPSGRNGTSGHPEIEMALVELYRTTRNAHYLTQAQLFLDRRGSGVLGGRDYLLDHLPFRQMEILAGHAVRALYLCSGAADLCLENGETELKDTLEKLWSHLVDEQMYITGGVGSRHDGEAIGDPYELPNRHAYAETCASIANVMWNWRMYQLNGDARYLDLMEWTLYNAVLPGISIDSRKYFYVNPLQSDASHQRQTWFDCACCPPNIARTIAMLPGYLYSTSSEGIWINFFANSMANLELPTGEALRLEQTCAYPWEGQICLEVKEIERNRESGHNPDTMMEMSFFIRIPGWLDNKPWILRLNNQLYPHTAAPGTFLEIHRQWKPADVIEIEMPMDVRYIESHPAVLENVGRVAVSRGPLIYCLEEVDNPGISFSEVIVDTSGPTSVTFNADLLCGINEITLSGQLSPVNPEWDGKLYRTFHRPAIKPVNLPIQLRMVPYFAWANRQPGGMQIWLRYQ